MPFGVNASHMFLKKDSDETTTNLFVQLNSDSPTMTAIREVATIRINEIVKEELGLPADYDFFFFFSEIVRPLMAELGRKLSFQQLSIFLLDPKGQRRSYIKDCALGA